MTCTHRQFRRQHPPSSAHFADTWAKTRPISRNTFASIRERNPIRVLYALTDQIKAITSNRIFGIGTKIAWKVLRLLLKDLFYAFIRCRVFAFCVYLASYYPRDSFSTIDSVYEDFSQLLTVFMKIFPPYTHTTEKWKFFVFVFHSLGSHSQSRDRRGHLEIYFEDFEFFCKEFVRWCSIFAKITQIYLSLWYNWVTCLYTW